MRLINDELECFINGSENNYSSNKLRGFLFAIALAK